MENNEAPVNDLEVEKWQEGLFECSFDRKEHLRIDPPTREVEGTEHERFVVTRREINQGVAMVRKVTDIAKLPDKFPVPTPIAEVYDRSKTLYTLILSIEFQIRSLCYFSDGKYANTEDMVAEINDKLTKLTRFADTTREKTVALHKLLGSPDKEEEKHVHRQVTRVHDRPARPAKSRKDPARKSFSLTNLMDSD